MTAIQSRSITMADDNLLGGTEPRRQKHRIRKPRKFINPYAACVVVFHADGKERMYLNAALPIDGHPADGICGTCGHSYAHLIDSGEGKCRECHGDDMAARAWLLEEAGIRLGWGHHRKDAINLDYMREQHGTSAGKRRLQQDAKEV